MTRRHTRILVAAGAALALAGAASPLALASGSPAARSPRPQLTARPDSARKGTKILVTGSGWKPHAKVTIEECSAKTWIAPKFPCTNGNDVTVRASKHGRFNVRFTVKACPAPPGAAAARTRVCYLGEPHGVGVDVITLVGATRIKITG